jgi:23S rRNA-/tRNA-specific pseudouridylate synthase
VVPETARSHQVRVHLSHLGYPIVADKDYGVRDNLLLSEIKRGYKTRPGVVERPLLNRMFLHIARISWPESDGQIRTVESRLPGELDLVLSKLRSFAPRHRN